MPQLTKLWTGMLTRSSEDAGTDSRLALTIDANQILLPNTFQEDLERGEANVYDRMVENLNISTEDLNPSSIRVTLLGDDQWTPRHFFVWGEQLNDGAIVPLAIETDISTKLSTDPSEGHAGLPLRPVTLGSAAMTTNQLLVLMVTSNADDAGTPDSIRIRVLGNDEVRFVNHALFKHQKGQANLAFVPVDIPFTKAEVGSIQLSINGNEAWLPDSMFVFGLDTEEGRPNLIVPLVHLPIWELGWLSTDTSEGQPTVRLPLV